MQAVKLGSLRSFTQSFFPVNAEIPLRPPTGWWELHYKLWRVTMSNVFCSLKSNGIRLISSAQRQVGGQKVAENKITACKRKRLSWWVYLSAIGSSRSLRAFAVALPPPFRVAPSMELRATPYGALWQILL